MQEYRAVLKLQKLSDYWCTNVNDNFFVLCYRYRNGYERHDSSECVISRDGIQFDNRKTSRLNADYNQYARMTTFDGKAVLVGIVSSHNGNHATAATKFVEVFDVNNNQWLLHRPEDRYGVAYTSQFALVPLKTKLLQLGGNDIGSGNYGYHGELGFYLDLMFTKWINFGNRDIDQDDLMGTG